ncbi:MAG: hypothetical protein WA441_03740 [Methyloceanibacter sp.]
MRDVALAMLVGILATAAQAEPASWIAMSKTAMSITGDIVLDDYSLAFKNGKSLDLEPYEMAREGDWSGSGEEISGDVFKIDPPSNPKLLHGNTLCGAPATYVVLWTPGEGELTLNVYSGDGAPTGTPDVDALCATYSYEAP